MFLTLPYVSVKPNYFTTYTHFDCTRDHFIRKHPLAPQPLENKSHGLMSDKANKRVRLAIDWLINISKEKPLIKKGVKTSFNFKLNFITLTLSSKQRHSDNVIKHELLNQFLTELRTKHKCTNYLWRAESQRNGNIHFHLVTDVFIPWRVLRSDWNRIQEKLGYCSAYTAKTGNSDPNSTDVHSINDVKNLSAYLAKYCTKNSKGYVVMATKASPEPFRPRFILNYKHEPLKPKATFYRQIHGKLWGLSQSLSRLKSACKEVSGRLAIEVEWLRNRYKTRIRYVNRAVVFFFNYSELLKVKCLALANLFESYKESILNPTPPPSQICIGAFNEVPVNAVFKPVQARIMFD
jgi:hypothetical protein